MPKRVKSTVARQKVRDRWQIALYVPKELVRPLKTEAHRRQRAYSVTVVEILAQFFEEQQMQNRIADKLIPEVPAAQ